MQTYIAETAKTVAARQEKMNTMVEARRALLASSFSINELAAANSKNPTVLDDRGKQLFPGNMVPGYGGWGQNGPTEFVTVDGRKALFAEPVAKTALGGLRLKWT